MKKQSSCREEENFLVKIQQLQEKCLGPLKNISKGKLFDEVFKPIGQ
jgi:hypothetical protein